VTIWHCDNINIISMSRLGTLFQSAKLFEAVGVLQPMNVKQMKVQYV